MSKNTKKENKKSEKTETATTVDSAIKKRDFVDDERELLLTNTQEHLKRAATQVDEELLDKLMLLERVKEMFSSVSL